MRIEAQPAAETPRGLFRATLYRELGEDGASLGVGFGQRALSEKMENEVSRCGDGKHAEQRGQHSNEIANVLHFPLPVECALR
jgi:hypothetical protein